mmetsp:Transcript_23359/g.43933  ORF Transcript_23359/g.43933 Transcript_23359/m.43933 type:complete len:231 (-) Transcript_23359:407-1099(-)
MVSKIWKGLTSFQKFLLDCRAYICGDQLVPRAQLLLDAGAVPLEELATHLLELVALGCCAARLGFRLKLLFRPPFRQFLCLHLCQSVLPHLDLSVCRDPLAQDGIVGAPAVLRRRTPARRFRSVTQCWLNCIPLRPNSCHRDGFPFIPKVRLCSAQRCWVYGKLLRRNSDVRGLLLCHRSAHGLPKRTNRTKRTKRRCLGHLGLVLNDLSDLPCQPSAGLQLCSFCRLKI